MNMVSMSISKERERQRYLPLKIRLQMYEDVVELRKQGLTYKEIQRKIYEKYEVRLRISTIHSWVKEISHPLGNVNNFDEKPSPELSYIIGAIITDGNLNVEPLHHCYHLRLKVKDKEFAEEFGKCLAKVLKKDKPYKPFWDKNCKAWIIKVSSILLYNFLSNPLEKLKIHIEYSKKAVSSFLRALFDGEGSIAVDKKRRKRELTLYNTNIELLIYTQYLLKRYFNINTTGPHFNKKTIKNCYYIYVRTNSLLNFYKNIRFVIKRKQRKLIQAIKQ